MMWCGGERLKVPGERNPKHQQQSRLEVRMVLVHIRVSAIFANSLVVGVEHVSKEACACVQ